MAGLFELPAAKIELLELAAKFEKLAQYADDSVR